MLSGRGLCDKLITRPEESYRLWCVVVCDLENLKNEEVMTRVGSQRNSKKNIILNLVEIKKISTLLALREDFGMFIGRVSFMLYTLNVSVLVKDFPSVFMLENFSKGSNRSLQTFTADVAH